MNKNKLLNDAKKAAIWGYLGSGLKLVIQLGVQILMARHLGPAEYGVFAIGVIVIAFAMFFGDVASSALIPEKNISDKMISFAFTWQFLVSLAVSSAVYFGAPLIANFMHAKEAVPVVQMLAWVCVINAIGGVALSLLRRNLDFKSIQIAQLAGYIVGYVFVGLPYAFFISANVNALVFAWLIQTFVTALLYLRASPHSLIFKFYCPEWRELVSFGRNALLSNLSLWAQSNLDRIIVAKFFSAQHVGLYTTASNLMSTPLAHLNATFQQVAFSATARLDNQSGELAGLVKKMIVLSTLGAFLIYGWAFINANLIVAVLYGDKWLEAIPFIQVFAIVYFSNAVSGVITPLLWSQNKITFESRLQLIVFVLMLVSCFIAAKHSILSLAIAVALVFLARMVALIVAAILFFNMRFRFGEFVQLFGFLVILFMYYALFHYAGSFFALHADFVLQVLSLGILFSAVYVLKRTRQLSRVYKWS